MTRTSMGNADEALNLGAKLGWIAIPLYLKDGRWTAPYRYIADLHLDVATFDESLWDRLWKGHENAPGIGAVWPSDVIAADADSDDAAAWLYEHKMPRTPTFDSRRGPHYLFAGDAAGLNPEPAPRLEVLSRASGKQLLVLPPTPGKAWRPSLGPFDLSFAPVPACFKGAKSNGHRRARVKIDVALSLPTLTEDGKTYRFQLRPGIRYSDGEIVLASDFLRAIERGFRIQNPLVTFSYFGSLIGGRECKKMPASCDLSEGIVTEDQAGTITFHLSKPDPDFLNNLALPHAFPVPPSMPIDEERIRAGVPGTGPYKLESPMTRDGLVLVRNEYFQEWSAGAQPDGNVDRIEWTFGGTPDELADAVANDEADYLVAGDHPPSGIDDLRVEFAAQVHEHPHLDLIYLSLNTKLPPFKDEDVRRALNFAVDRERIVEFFGGPSAARLTCQILPPNTPGYEPYCPYTVDPGPGGQWTGPDMEEAQRLVRRSGTAGTHVTFWYSPAFSGSPKAQANYFVNLLEDLHFEVDLKSTAGAIDWRHDPSAAYDAHFDALRDPGRGIQIAPAGWVADFPSASSFIATLLKCNLFPTFNYGGFCDRDVDRMMEDAAQIPTADPASGRAWAEVDHAITDQAPFVSLVNGVRVDFVSSRLRNYQYNPVWGLLLAQVWVR
jgi:peptide/nickel transport system substrate-binding protein